MRHQLITRAALTVFKEETEALELLTFLSWAMPLMVYSTSFLDTLMMVLYQKWLHPWRRILAKVCGSFSSKAASRISTSGGDNGWCSESNGLGNVTGAKGGRQIKDDILTLYCKEIPFM